MYGEYEILRRYCQINKKSIMTVGNTYQHGWHGKDKNLHPEIVIGTNGRESNNKNRLQLVYRIDQEIYLKANGFKNVCAIGCPLVYLPKIDPIKRIKKSALIVPMHTEPGSIDRIDEDKFCEDIGRLTSQFENICFLLHKNCVESGLWIKTLEKYKFRYVFGAGHYDETSYFRLAEIFSKYEWIISNYLGSHVPFSAFFGAKVCLIPCYHEIKNDNYKNTPFYLGLDDNVKNVYESMCKKSYVENFYPFLFNNCISDFDFQGWANDELGLKCKKTKKEIKKILGWDFIGQIKLKVNKSIGLLWKIIIFLGQFAVMSSRLGLFKAIVFMKRFRSPDYTTVDLPVSKSRTISFYPSPKNRLMLRKVLKLP